MANVDVRTGEEIIPCEYTYLTARFKKFQYLYNNQKSNIDENIPVCKISNNKCYAVIIANEKYTREQNVPYALNDGKTFSEYCKKTLGLPDNNIHYAENVTLNDIKYHLSWLKNQVKWQVTILKSFSIMLDTVFLMSLTVHPTYYQAMALLSISIQDIVLKIYIKN